MTEKYYTPSLEEFHIGLEFERFYEPSWEPSIYSENHVGLYEMERLIKLSRIRVKHLDREDIESLLAGQNYKNDDLKYMNGTGVVCRYIQGSKYHEAIQITLYEDGIVNITKYKFQGENSNSYWNLFQGKCHNKSELKFIMKRLGIETKNSETQS